MTKEEKLKKLELPVDDATSKTLDINGNPSSFSNNVDLLAKNAKLPLTEEHIEEILKCSNDPIYFIENYVKIFDLDKGWTLPTLRKYQKDIIKNYKTSRFNQIMAGRQTGKSTTIVMCILWEIIFNKDTVVGMCAHKMAMAKENMARLQEYFKNVPVWLKPGVVRWHQTYITLDNGSRVYISTATKDAFRGLGIKILFIDECVSKDSIVTIQDDNGIVFDITIEELYKRYHGLES